MEDINISFGNLINDVLDVMHKDEYKEIPIIKKRESCSDPNCSVISSEFDHEKYESYENKQYLSKKQESRYSSITKSYRSSELVPVLEER